MVKKAGSPPPDRNRVWHGIGGEAQAIHQHDDRSLLKRDHGAFRDGACRAGGDHQRRAVSAVVRATDGVDAIRRGHGNIAAVRGDPERIVAGRAAGEEIPLRRNAWATIDPHHETFRTARRIGERIVGSFVRHV